VDKYTWRRLASALERLFRPVLIASMFFCILLFSLPVSAESRGKAEFRKLKEIRDGIYTLSFVQETNIEDSRADGKKENIRRIVQYQFKRDRGLMRHELLFSDPPISSSNVTDSKEKGLKRDAKGRIKRDIPRIVVGKSDAPSPGYIFGIPESILANKVRVVAKGKGQSIEVAMSSKRGFQVGKRIECNADGLPEKINTFNSHGKLLDEMTVTWVKNRGNIFPDELVLVQHSRLNTLTTHVCSVHKSISGFPGPNTHRLGLV